MNFINIIGIVFALALLIPNVKFPLQKEEKLTFARGASLTGFYGCLLLLGFNFGILELEGGNGGVGLDYVALFWIWVVLGTLLAGGYVICYLFAYRTKKSLLRGLLPVIAFVLFFASGILLGHLLFYPFALLYAGACIPLLFRKSDKAANEDTAPTQENEPKGTDKE